MCPSFSLCIRLSHNPDSTSLQSPLKSDILIKSLALVSTAYISSVFDCVRSDLIAGQSSIFSSHECIFFYPCQARILQSHHWGSNIPWHFFSESLCTLDGMDIITNEIEARTSLIVYNDLRFKIESKGNLPWSLMQGSPCSLFLTHSPSISNS